MAEGTCTLLIILFGGIMLLVSYAFGVYRRHK